MTDIDTDTGIDHIRVSLPLAIPGGPAAENLWAKNLGGGFAEVDNLPFFTDLFTVGSIVAVDEHGRIIAVKSHAYAATGLAALADNEDTATNRAFFDRLDAVGIAYERGFGAVACAIPAESIADWEQIASTDAAVSMWSYEMLPTAPYRT